MSRWRREGLPLRSPNGSVGRALRDFAASAGSALRPLAISRYYLQARLAPTLAASSECTVNYDALHLRSFSASYSRA